MQALLYGSFRQDVYALTNCQLSDPSFLERYHSFVGATGFLHSLSAYSLSFVGVVVNLSQFGLVQL